MTTSSLIGGKNISYGFHITSSEYRFSIYTGSKTSLKLLPQIGYTAQLHAVADMVTTTAILPETVAARYLTAFGEASWLQLLEMSPSLADSDLNALISLGTFASYITNSKSMLQSVLRRHHVKKDDWQFLQSRSNSSDATLSLS